MIDSMKLIRYFGYEGIKNDENQTLDDVGCHDGVTNYP
jgi:hypothetical protein